MAVQRLRSPLARCHREKPLGVLPLKEGIFQEVSCRFSAASSSGSVVVREGLTLSPPVPSLARTLFIDSKVLAFSEKRLALARKFFHSDPARPPPNICLGKHTFIFG